MKTPMTPNTKPSIYMFLNERGEGRKKEASKVKQTNKGKATQHMHNIHRKHSKIINFS